MRIRLKVSEMQAASGLKKTDKIFTRTEAATRGEAKIGTL